MGTKNWPGSSEESNLSGPSIQGKDLEAPSEEYFDDANQAIDPFVFDPVSGEPSLNEVRTLPTWEEMIAEADAMAALNSLNDDLDSPSEDLENYDESALLARTAPDDPYQRADRVQGWQVDNSYLEVSSAVKRKQRIAVLRSAEPLIMPPPINVKVYGGVKRVQRLLPVMTGEEQTNYIPWTPERGAVALAEIDPSTLDDDDLLSYIQATERQSSWAMARQAAAIAEFSTRRPPVIGEEPPSRHPDRSRYAAAEIMALFALGVGAAERLMCEAELLTKYLPDTFEQFNDGSLDVRRVRAIVQGTHNTPPELLHELEPEFLRFAMNANPNALLRKVRATAVKHNPEPLTTRHERARTERDVWLIPLPDGMANLGARLPAVEATLFFNSIDDWARNAKSSGEDSHGTTSTGRPSRSLNEYRADVLMDLLHEALFHPTMRGRSVSGEGTATPAQGAGELHRTNGRPSPAHRHLEHRSPGHGSPGHRGQTRVGEGGNRLGIPNMDKSATDKAAPGSPTSAKSATGSPTTEKPAPGSPATAKSATGSPPEGPSFRRRIPATLNVSISAQSLLGLSNDPAILAGYGPIPVDQAQEMSATATFWRKFLTDPETGCITSIGRKSRKPPQSMARVVRLKDPVCTGIGCDRPARSCELDHTRPYNRNSYAADGALLPRGETSIDNLRPRCAYCHHVKDDLNTGWTVQAVSPGVTRTTSPTGRVYLQTQGDIPAPF